MDCFEVTEVLRGRLAPFAVPDSFSFAFGSKSADMQCEVEGGRTVGVRLTPARSTLTMSFLGRSGIPVSLKIEEATLEDLAVTAAVTVETLLRSP